MPIISLRRTLGQLPALLVAIPKKLSLHPVQRKPTTWQFSDFAEAAPAKRKRILVSEIEHKSVLEAAELASQRYGCDVEYIPVDRNGVVRLEALERMMELDVLLICVMWVNNEVGSIQPIKSIAALADGAGALLHCDATHALNCERLSFYGIGAHSVSLSAHKIYGPKGVGALLIRRDARWPRLFGQNFRFDKWNVCRG